MGCRKGGQETLEDVGQGPGPRAVLQGQQKEGWSQLPVARRGCPGSSWVTLHTSGGPIPSTRALSYDFW